MAIWICEFCGEEFERDKRGSRTARFCSQRCYHNWRMENPDQVSGGQFKKGSIPWNKNLKGIHLSPETEFKPGMMPLNKLPIGSIRIRFNKKENRKRAWIKISDNGNSYDWKLRAVLVWEQNYGPLLKGMILHHVDRDTLNDDMENLMILDRGSHLMEHRPEFEEKRKQRASKANKERWQEYRLSKYDSYYWKDVKEL